MGDYSRYFSFSFFSFSFAFVDALTAYIRLRDLLGLPNQTKGRHKSPVGRSYNDWYLLPIPLLLFRVSIAITN